MSNDNGSDWSEWFEAAGKVIGCVLLIAGVVLVCIAGVALGAVSQAANDLRPKGDGDKGS